MNHRYVLSPANASIAIAVPSLPMLMPVALVLFVALFAALVGACGPLGDGGDDAGVTDDLPAASAFSCADVAGAPTKCIDFNDGQAPGLSVEDGSFAVVGGRYVGDGPDVAPSSCGTSLMSHARIAGAVQDVRVRMQMASVVRVDKALVLRADDGNRIQLNFRAHDEDGNFGDLMVQEVRDCVFTTFTSDGEIPVDHAVGQKIDVVAELVGAHLNVSVDGATVVDRDFPVRIGAGDVGMAIIDRSRTVFDDVVIESLDVGG